ncbi:MAG: methylmalonyl Co-A mutase-associated GTPase MeaB [Gemmatimonadota bacterium]|nr:MAG: methylmalonyl Co-A mutase-associated GTPase MeaB [Gemmatimonadota bacterium]
MDSRNLKSGKSKELVSKLLEGDRLAAARLISIIEDDSVESSDIVREIFPHTGRAYRIGVTGPPGVGKSTLVDRLTVTLRGEGVTVGIIAVDPTSPFSGGALLGDRVRMTDIGMDDGVFIRSMATRGNLGGLAKTTSDVADVFDAFGKDVILFETVGVGQSELDIVEAADTTVVVLVPESGDSVQAMKAGLMEIADIFVVNKADREGADNAVREIEVILDMTSDQEGWTVPVLKTVAHEGDGVDALRRIIDQHYRYLASKEKLAEKRRKRVRAATVGIVQEKLHSRVWNDPRIEEFLKKRVDEITTGNGTPHSAAEEILHMVGFYNHSECMKGEQ